MSKRRRKAADLEHWLAHAATPVFILDADRHVVAFNAGCETLTGWDADDIVGSQGHYQTAPDGTGPVALAASLCPPPEVFAGAELAAPVHLVHKAGHALPRLLHFFPLCDEEERVQGILGIILPLDQPRPPPEISPARQLHAELAAARHSLRARFGPGTLIATGPVMRRVLVQAELARQTATPVLLRGEPGTGKEHLARMIHLGGAGRDNWFVPLECKRLGADELERVWLRLIETHRPSPRGTSPQPGTVYLADVECLPRELQERLVKEFVPDEPARALPLRLVTSTTRDLERDALEPALRPDFYALISPLTIILPPLRDRGADLPLLAQHFLEECNRDERQTGGFDESIWPLFSRYHWPENLDELAVVIRDAHARATESLIRVDDLPFRFRTALDAQQIPPPRAQQSLPLDDLLLRVETRLIALALERAKNNRSKAAEILCINRSRLVRRIEQLRLEAGAPEEPTETSAPPPADNDGQ